PRAFETLARDVERALYRHVLRIVRESADAEDCVQDALLSAWRSIGSFQGDSFRAWIFRIATNRALDRLRMKRRHPELPLDPPADEDQPTWAEPVAAGPDLMQIAGDREALAGVELALGAHALEEGSDLALGVFAGFALADDA